MDVRARTHVLATVVFCVGLAACGGATGSPQEPKLGLSLGASAGKPPNPERPDEPANPCKPERPGNPAKPGNTCEPDSKAMARIAIVPGYGTLVRTGKNRQRVLRAVDVDGVEGPIADPTHTVSVSATPDQVPAGNTGPLSSFVSAGSTQIGASLGGSASTLVTVVVAPVLSGAQFVRDDQIVNGPALVEPEAGFGVGTRYPVTLAGVPEPELGGLLQGPETAAIGRRVVDVQEVGGQFRGTLEILPVTQHHRDIQIEETWDLNQSRAAIPKQVQNLYAVTRQPNGSWRSKPHPVAAEAMLNAVSQAGPMGTRVPGAI